MSWKPNKFRIRVVLDNDYEKMCYLERAWVLCDNVNRATEFDEGAGERLFDEIKRQWKACTDVYSVKVK